MIHDENSKNNSLVGVAVIIILFIIVVVLALTASVTVLVRSKNRKWSVLKRLIFH